MLTETKGIYEFGPYRLDAARRTLRCGEELVPLTSKLFDTLLALVANHQRALLKEELMKSVWPDSFVEEVNLAQNVSALRKLLGESPGQNRYIATIPGKGYRFVGEVREHPPAAPSPERPPAPAAGHAGPNRSLLLFVASCVFAALTGSVYIIGIARKRAISPPRSVAVLPFRSLGKQLDDDHLGLGMTDAVITKLSNLRQLVVRPTSAVLRYTQPQSIRPGPDTSWPSSPCWTARCKNRATASGLPSSSFASITVSLYGRRPSTIDSRISLPLRIPSPRRLRTRSP